MSGAAVGGGCWARSKKGIPIGLTTVSAISIRRAVNKADFMAILSRRSSAGAWGVNGNSAGCKSVEPLRIARMW